MSQNEPKISVSGGRLHHKYLTSALDKKTYDMARADVWLTILKEKKVPTKWFKATKAGTKISFIYPKTQKEWNDSYDDLKAYIVSVNEKHGTDLYLGRDEEKKEEPNEQPDHVCPSESVSG